MPCSEVCLVRRHRAVCLVPPLGNQSTQTTFFDGEGAGPGASSLGRSFFLRIKDWEKSLLKSPRGESRFCWKVLEGNSCDARWIQWGSFLLQSHLLSSWKIEEGSANTFAVSLCCNANEDVNFVDESNKTGQLQSHFSFWSIGELWKDASSRKLHGGKRNEKSTAVNASWLIDVNSHNLITYSTYVESRGEEGSICSRTNMPQPN